MVLPRLSATERCKCNPESENVPLSDKTSKWPVAFVPSGWLANRRLYCSRLPTQVTITPALMVLAFANQQWIVSDRHEASTVTRTCSVVEMLPVPIRIIQTRLAKINREDFCCAVIQASVTGTSDILTSPDRASQECILAFLGLITQVVEQRCISGKFLDSGLTVKFGIEWSFQHAQRQRTLRNDLLHHSTVVSSSLSSGTTLFIAHFQRFPWHRTDRTGTRSRGLSFCPTMR